jgi:drug/metabolite transporter (DMT)-like permease
VTLSSNPSAATTRRAWIAWVAVCLIWGTTYLAIKVALETVPPFLLGGLRYVTGGAILAGVLLSRGQRLPAFADWGKLAVLGFFMLLLGNGGVVWGEQVLASGLTAVLIATSPFWMVGIDALWPDGARLRVKQWLGLSIGFAGIVVLVWPDLVSSGASARDFIWGTVAVQIACLGWAIGSSYTRRHVMPGDVLGAAAMQMIFGGMFMLLAGSLIGEWGRIGFNGRTSLAVAYLTLAGSVIAFAAYSYALQHLDLAIVSLYTYVNPVIAVVLGTLMLGEPFGIRMLVAAGIIVVGVLVVGPVSSQRRKT